MIGKYAVKTTPLRKLLGLIIVVLFGILLSRFVSVSVEQDICGDSGRVWNAAAKKCDPAPASVLPGDTAIPETPAK